MKNDEVTTQDDTNRLSEALARFAANLGYEDIPEVVRDRTVNLYVDWLASAFAGKGGRPVE